MKYGSKGKKKKKNLYDQMMKRKSKPMKGYGG